MIGAAFARMGPAASRGKYKLQGAATLVEGQSPLSTLLFMADDHDHHTLFRAGCCCEGRPVKVCTVNGRNPVPRPGPPTITLIEDGLDAGYLFGPGLLVGHRVPSSACWFGTRYSEGLMTHSRPTGKQWCKLGKAYALIRKWANFECSIGAVLASRKPAGSASNPPADGTIR